MKTLKALLLSFVFVLISSFSFAEVGMKFNYFGATAYKTEGNTWEAFMLTDVVTTSEVPVKDVAVYASWGKDNVEICHTNRKGKCRFHITGLNGDAVQFRILAVEKEGYIFNDPYNMSMLIMRP